MRIESHPWTSPLDALKALHTERTLLCLYSAFTEAHTGRYSFLCWHPTEEIATETWAEFAAKTSSDRHWYENAWFGWMGYGLRHTNETLPHAARTYIHHPALCMMRFAHMLRFDHAAKQVEYYHDKAPDRRWQNSIKLEPSPIKVASLRSDSSKRHYLDTVHETVQHIAAGDFYQANITRKFMGNMHQAAEPVRCFLALCEISPAPYSAFIKRGDDAILSSSPECFLSITREGNIITRPIKGSAATSDNPERDADIRKALQESAKDHAENRMIVDLMRNDLARVSIPGSVKVTESSALYRYATIHHLISTITAEKRPDCSTAEAVIRCFPPGSMTGAPKIAAMEWCSTKEPLERGIYSGAIGWFGGDGSCDLSVVIRTLLLRGKEFEFQVGGGIVADSIPETEWEETLTKAKALRSLLDIPEEQIRAL